MKAESETAFTDRGLKSTGDAPDSAPISGIRAPSSPRRIAAAPSTTQSSDSKSAQSASRSNAARPQNPSEASSPIAPEPSKPAGSGDQSPSEVVAREALRDVGTDLDAEAVWLSAINDRTIAAEARKNLIEDLNEDGFSDPKHVTKDELPLVKYRMQLIEQLAPSAIDETNAEAFRESYKDLAAMYKKVRQ